MFLLNSTHAESDIRGERRWIDVNFHLDAVGFVLSTWFFTLVMTKSWIKDRTVVETEQRMINRRSRKKNLMESLWCVEEYIRSLNFSFQVGRWERALTAAEIAATTKRGGDYKLDGRII